MNNKINVFINKGTENLSEVIVFGAGYYGIMCIYLMQYLGIKVVLCMDNDVNKNGKIILEKIECKSPYYYKNIPIVISIYNKSVIEKIQKQCKELGYKDFIYLDFDNLERELMKLPDKEYLEMKFAMMFGGKLINWNELKTFNEKLQWLKLYDRNSKYSNMVDKYEVKKYIKKKIGSEYIIPTLGVWSHFDEINFDKLPSQFVLKCTHDSGGVIVVKDKKKLNKIQAKEKIEEKLKRNYYYYGREWPYKDVKPRIMAECYMEEKDSPELKDYKIFCFLGKPKFILTVSGGHEDESKTERRMYDTEWNRYDVGLHGKKPVSTSEKKPEQLNKMFEIAAKLSEGIKHVRIDLYIVNNNIYFGEMTFYHMAGYEIFDPIDYDYLFGTFLEIDK